jgi:molybdenum cofactor cytidylyltransferase
MKFGVVPLAQAEGGVAVHSIRQGSLVLKKGTIIGRAELTALAQAGIGEIAVARVEPGDVSEDAAAAEIAAAVRGEGVRVDRAFTGRANLFAETAGVLVVDKAGIDRLNEVDESITFATLAAYKPVVAGEMVATVKIIPFAVAAAHRDAAVAAARRQDPLIRVAPYSIRKVGVISTLLPGIAPKVIDKTLKVTRQRLAPANAHIIDELRVPHEQAALAAALEQVLSAGAELVIVFGASAIADRRDVIPAAVETIGGRVAHFGMPVDPGNLLMIGSLRGASVLGAPGCARSPKENGFDWVLMRLLARLPVPREAITGMGVGGLLMEIVTRPQPRGETPVVHEKRIAAVVLAAGRSTRMGGPNKLLAEIAHRPLVRIAAEAALASRARPVIVVAGHQRDELVKAVADLPVQVVHNPDFADGLATSVRAGISAVPAECDGALVCLGDMPRVDAALINRLIEAFDLERGALIALPTVHGKRGNPVLWSRRFFPDLMAVEGDVGGRHLIERYGEAVVEVPLAGEAQLADVDTPEALCGLKQEMEQTRRDDGGQPGKRIESHAGARPH